MKVSNTILDRAQRSLLAAVLNRIVPAEGAMPAAGDLGIAAFVESVAAGSSAARRQLLDGLTRIELTAGAQGSSFGVLSPEAQVDVLQTVAAASPAFFQELVTQTYRGYYTNESVCDLLSYRAPNRADYRPIPFDESLLEPVRQRGQLWTRADG